MAAEDSSIVTTGLLVGDTLGQLKFLHVPVSLVGGPAAQASIAKKWNAAGIEELVLQQALAQRLNAEDVKASKREVASVCMARVEDWSRVPDGEEGEEDIQLVDVATVLWAGGYLQWIRLDTVQVVCSVLLSILPKPPSSEPDHTYAHPQGGVVRTITDVCDGKRITCVACTESGQLHVVRLDLENKQGCKCSIERSFEVRGPVHALAVSNDGVLAIGGKGNELCLWDSRTGQNMFKAKAPKADMLGYVPKPWVTALEFIPGSGGTKVVAATGHAQIRVYDAHLQRKPVLLIKFGEGPVMSIAISPRGDQLFAGSTSGDIHSFDLSNGNRLGAFKGSTGSVRCIVAHPSLPVIASCGLDRFVRVFHSTTRKPLAKLCLKQMLTCVSIAGDLRVPHETTAGTPSVHAMESRDVVDAANSDDPSLPGEVGEGETADDGSLGQKRKLAAGAEVSGRDRVRKSRKPK
mmetsp:Transcript_8005/g.29600  ORF Transcript_8005/g.29600 Transcript_8005/m.29600 type:complete len:463 (+) Transcript_8005:79-1467(+)